MDERLQGAINRERAQKQHQAEKARQEAAQEVAEQAQLQAQLDKDFSETADIAHRLADTLHRRGYPAPPITVHSVHDRVFSDKLKDIYRTVGHGWLVAKERYSRGGNPEGDLRLVDPPVYLSEHGTLIIMKSGHRKYSPAEPADMYNVQGVDHSDRVVERIFSGFARLMEEHGISPEELQQQPTAPHLPASSVDDIRRPWEASARPAGQTGHWISGEEALRILGDDGF